MLGKVWRRFFRRKENVPRAESQEPRVESPVPRAEPGTVSLIMDDGTVVSPPSDTELDEKFRYLTDNLIPGAGNPKSGDTNEG